MKLRDAKKIMLETMGHYHLNNWDFQFNRNSMALGTTYQNDNRIELSAAYVVKLPPNRVRDVMLHEIAHALAGYGTGHGKEWKLIAASLGATPEQYVPLKIIWGPLRYVCTMCSERFATCVRLRHVHSFCACGGRYVKDRTLYGAVRAQIQRWL